MLMFMSSSAPTQDVQRFPGTLTLKDLISIVSIAVSIALGWGVFGTRITVLEKEVVTISARMSSFETSIANVSAHVRALETTQHENTIYIRQLFYAAKLPAPSK